jgi:hypothetical protein
MVAGSYGGSRLAKPRPARGGVAEEVAAHRVLHAAPAEPRLTPEDREDDGLAGGPGTGNVPQGRGLGCYRPNRAPPRTNLVRLSSTP